MESANMAGILKLSMALAVLVSPAASVEHSVDSELPEFETEPVENLEEARDRIQELRERVINLRERVRELETELERMEDKMENETQENESEEEERTEIEVERGPNETEVEIERRGPPEGVAPPNRSSSDRAPSEQAGEGPSGTPGSEQARESRPGFVNSLLRGLLG